MGALVFYAFIYFIGHFFAHGLNLLTNREILNRRWIGLTSVLLMAAFHGYRIFNSVPPFGHDESAMEALGYYVIFPVGVIVTTLLYLNWKSKEDDRKDDISTS